MPQPEVFFFLGFKGFTKIYHIIPPVYSVHRIHHRALILSALAIRSSHPLSFCQKGSGNSRAVGVLRIILRPDTENCIITENNE